MTYGVVHQTPVCPGGEGHAESSTLRDSEGAVGAAWAGPDALSFTAQSVASLWLSNFQTYDVRVDGGAAFRTIYVKGMARSCCALVVADLGLEGRAGAKALPVGEGVAAATRAAAGVCCDQLGGVFRSQFDMLCKSMLISAV